MILKDIAEKVDMDISTISRVANSKYIDTPYGVKLLKTFFSEGLKNDEGEDVSTIEIKKILEAIYCWRKQEKTFDRSDPFGNDERKRVYRSPQDHRQISRTTWTFLWHECEESFNLQ